MRHARSPFRTRQSGLALLALLAVVLLAFAYTVVSGFAKSRLQAERQASTSRALAQAKEALLAWSVMQGDADTSTNLRPPRPGTLPCPDTANTGFQAGSCAVGSGTTIGRLPWKTLGIDDLRDADGERLWYVLSNNFRREGLTNAAINSDASGTLQLYAANGTTLLTPAGEELVAIVFSAGAPLASQDRAAGPNAVANYLESANGKSNAAANGPFISGPVQDAQGNVILNDVALTISARELIKAIEKRALREAQNGLAAFAAANGGKYPNPGKYNDAECMAAINGTSSHSITDHNPCNSDSSVCTGRLPEDALSSHTSLWFIQNGWGRVMIYAVNKNDVINNSGPECSTDLNLDGAGKKYILIAPGARIAGQARPSSALSQYLEDSANQDAWTSLSAGQPAFSAPSSIANDQIRSMP